MTYYTILDTSIGPLTLVSNGVSLTGVYMANHKHGPALDPSWIHQDDAQPLSEASRQLEAYFRGELNEFDIPLELQGTSFQKRVWAELRRIPYGVTISYGELARRIGNPNASRAVGLANGQNPVSIVVPCHRVIGASGKLTGYGGGLDRKKTLLELESAKSAPRLLSLA